MEKTETGYSSCSPDLPGCVSTGSTPEETERNMREAIGFYIGDTDASIPVSGSIEQLSGLIAEGHDFEFQVFAGYGHKIADIADPRIRAAVTWMKQQVAAYRQSKG